MLYFDHQLYAKFDYWCWINQLSIALDANYVGWNAYDTLAFDYETNTESLEDTKSARKYENASSSSLLSSNYDNFVRD